MSAKSKVKQLVKYLRALGWPVLALKSLPPGWDAYAANHLRDSTKLVDRDNVILQFDPGKPGAVRVYTDLESGHNGSSFDKYEDEVPIDATFLDTAITYARNELRAKIGVELKQAERAAFERRIDGRMKRLGL